MKDISFDLDIKLPDSSLRILQKRYLIKDDDGEPIETVGEMFWRVASTIAEIDRDYLKYNKRKMDSYISDLSSRFFEMMVKLRFLPNSPCLMNAGREGRGNLAACYVIGLQDTMDDIFRAAKDLSIINKFGGGVGLPLSNLRSSKAKVSTTGNYSSGPIPFMKMFDTVHEVINSTAVRRAAGMMVLRVDHPDIREFIVSKSVEGDISNFNISVGITDKFMNAVKNDGKFELIEPHNGAVVEIVHAREIFDLIIENAWNNGEPGVVFLDTTNKYNPLPSIGEYQATNPCLTGDTMIPTDMGILRLDELVENKCASRVVTSDGAKSILEFIDSGENDVWRVKTQHGYEVMATSYHRFKLADGTIKTTSDLNIGDKLPLQDCPIHSQHLSSAVEDARFELLGWMIGDGWVSTNRSAGLCVGDKDIEYLDHFKELIKLSIGGVVPHYERKQFNTVQFISPRLYKFAIEYGCKVAKAGDKEVPSTIWLSNKDSQQAFLRGLFSADGSVCNRESKEYVKLNSKSKKLLQQAQILLANFGIKSNLLDRHRKAKMTQFRESEKPYYCDGIMYELSIASKFFIEKFAKEIRFVQDYKNEILDTIKVIKRSDPYASQFDSKIVDIEHVGKRRTYCLKVEDNEEFVANGIVVLNCAEQVLHAGDSCNLGSINLSKMVKMKGDDIVIDWELLETTVDTAVHFLDNVIDANKYPLPYIEDMSKKTRRIGLGVMGFADLLIQLKVPYNSQEAIQVAEKVMSCISYRARLQSQNLAEIKGPFPEYVNSLWNMDNWNKEDKKKWNRLKWGNVDSIDTTIMNKPLRNAALTTVAPTGSISLIADCSSGIEPNFGLAYERRNEFGYDGTMKIVHPLFERVAMESGIHNSEIFSEIVENGGSIAEVGTIAKDIRDVFVVTRDINYSDHLAIQATFQQYVDSSISKTINMPFSTSTDDVKSTYIEAWQMGCKGVTIYRDGSRVKQVLNVEDQKFTQLKRVTPRERVVDMGGVTSEKSTGCGKVYVTINHDEFGLAETFIRIGKSGGCVSCWAEIMGRLTSLLMRSNVAYEDIVKQCIGARCSKPLIGKDGGILSCPDAVGKVLLDHLKTYGDIDYDIDNSTLTHAPPECPQCGFELVMEEGCKKCYECGYEHCGG